jgi:HK97 family phage major capsid protein
MADKTIQLKPQTRSITLDRAAVQQDSRTVALAFASEQPVERYWGIEILDMSPGAMRTGRLSAGAPLLCDHDTRLQVGIVESISIGTDRVARADVRFGKSGRAEQEYQDVLDGIRTNVSVGYIIHAMVLESEKDDVATYRITDWEPYEISMVSVPADYVGSGVGRGSETTWKDQEIAITIKTCECEQEVTEPAETEIETETSSCDPNTTSTEERTMSVTTEEKIVLIANARKEAQADVREMLAIAAKRPDALMEMAREFISEGKGLEEFRAAAMERLFTASPVQVSAEIGLSTRETQQFNVLRAINALANPGDRAAQEAAKFEFECSRAVSDNLRKAPQGFYIPMDVQKRDLTVGTAADGGYTKQTTVMGASFIEMLRNKMYLQELGCTILSGLVGDIAIPKQSGGATAYWVAENTAVTESQQVLGQVPMAPKTVGTFTDISRKLLLQSSIDVQNMVYSDLATVLALALDYAGINGSGASNQPRGIINQAGIGSVAGGTNGLAPTWANIVGLETAVAVGNADVGRLGYLTTAKARGTLKTTQKATNLPFIWENGDKPGEGILNGYRAVATNQVPSNLVKGSSGAVCSAIIFGNFADALFGLWGGLDVLVDPYTGGAAGTVRVRVLQDADFAIRRAESFAAMLDALTP